MRILVVGAGAIGGYFGGRLLEAGRDVTFLVRPRRAAQLAGDGLVIESPAGSVTLPSPPTVLAGDIRAPFDLVLLATKAYDLDEAIESFAPAVGPHSAVLPLLNGMRHLEALDERFGAGRVMGGLCTIASDVDAAGHVRHMSDFHDVIFGERDGSESDRARVLAEIVAPARFNARLSTTIVLDMWEKWVFIAAAAGVTCLMRGAVGDIMAAAGPELAVRLLDECREIAAANGYTPRLESVERGRGILTRAGSPLTASMLRDVERGARTEADHILGDLLWRGEATGHEASLLALAYLHLRVYEARRQREAGPR